MSASATVPRGTVSWTQRCPEGSLFHLNNGGSTPGGQRPAAPSSPSLPPVKPPHPGQRLLLLRAQVPDSAAHGARRAQGSRGAGVPGVCRPAAWPRRSCLVSLGEQMLAPPQRESASPAPPRCFLASALGVLLAVARTHPTARREVTRPRGVPERSLKGKAADAAISKHPHQGILQVPAWQGAGRGHKGDVGKLWGTHLDPLSQQNGGTFHKPVSTL